MHSLLNRYLSRQKEPGIISLVVLRSHWTKLFHDLDLAEGRNSATGSRPKTQSFSSVILMVLPIKESLNFQRTFIHTFNIQEHLYILSTYKNAKAFFFYQNILLHASALATAAQHAWILTESGQ